MGSKLRTISAVAGILALAILGGLVGIRIGMQTTPQNAAHAASAGGQSSSVSEHSTASPKELWDRLMEGNARFVDGEPATRELIDRRAELAQGQHPRVIVVGCSDSRVSPELVFDQNLGDLFIIRTAGNVADPVALGSIEYAAEHLHARLLVVLGHEKCGAVAAAASGKTMPTPNLQAIVRKIAPALAALKASASGAELAAKGVAANVQQSARDIVANSPILRKEVAAGKLSIAKAVYHLETGKIDRLP